jgi:hypothetical protein
LHGKTHDNFRLLEIEKQIIMADKITLYAINAVGAPWDDESPFDMRVLPFTILPEVTVENISELFNENTFSWAGQTISNTDLADLKSVRYAIVHRYKTAYPFQGDEENESEDLVTKIAACLRLIRPMRQRALVMRGVMTQQGLDVHHFDHPINLMDVPEVQKLFHLRNADLELLRDVAPRFLTAMNGDYWKIRMALQYHDAGHWQDTFWKPRFSLWVSGVEALYTTPDSEHNGRLVTIERVKDFLGPDTNIYDPGDIPKYLPQAKFTVSEVMEDAYTVRNFIVHGERVPDKFYSTGRSSSGGTPDINRIGILFEGLSFVLRKSILRVLRDNLLEEFKSKSASRKYWSTRLLTRPHLMGRAAVLQLLQERNCPLKPGDITLMLNQRKQAQKLKLYTGVEITQYLSSGVQQGGIRENGDGTYSA